MLAEHPLRNRGNDLKTKQGKRIACAQTLSIPQTGTVPYRRRLANGLEVQIPAIRAELALPDLLPLAWELTEQLLARHREALEPEGLEIRCRRGCDRCCHFLVGLCPPEAAYLARWIDALPRRTQAVLLQRLEDAAAPLRRQVRKEHSPSTPGRVALSLNRLLRLHQALPEQPCPFLHKGLCSIYLQRPLACREHVSTTGGLTCDSDAGASRLPASVFQALIEATALVEDKAEEIVPLPLLTGWFQRNRGRMERAYPSQKILDALLDALENQMPSDWVSDAPPA